MSEIMGPVLSVLGTSAGASLGEAAGSSLAGSMAALPTSTALTTLAEDAPIFGTFPAASNSAMAGLGWMPQAGRIGGAMLGGGAGQLLGNAIGGPQHRLPVGLGIGIGAGLAPGGAGMFGGPTDKSVVGALLSKRSEEPTPFTGFTMKELEGLSDEQLEALKRKFGIRT